MHSFGEAPKDAVSWGHSQMSWSCSPALIWQPCCSSFLRGPEGIGSECLLEWGRGREARTLISQEVSFRMLRPHGLKSYLCSPYPS